MRHEVDFEQLKIENQQLQGKVDSKNQELLKLKLSSGKTLLVLNSYKQKVNKLTSESERMRKEIQGRKEMLHKIQVETAHVIEASNIIMLLLKDTIEIYINYITL